MSSEDLEFLQYLIENLISTPEEMAESFQKHPRYIKNRLELLENIGLCYNSGQSKYRTNLDDEKLNEKKDMILEFPFQDLSFSKQEASEWLDGNDLNNLQELQNEEEPVRLWDLDGGTTSIEKFHSFAKYSKMGIVKQSSNYDFELTQLGEDILANQYNGYEIAKNILPISLLPIHYTANWILKILGYFDNSSKNTVRDIDRAAWQAERIFHEEFENKTKTYSIVLFSLLVLVGAVCFRLIPIGLQRTGLIFDIVGAIFVALGLFRGRRGIAIESEELGGRFAGSIPLQPESVRAKTRSTLDGVFGTLLLTSGFTLQFVAITVS